MIWLGMYPLGDDGKGRTWSDWAAKIESSEVQKMWNA